MTGAKEMAPLPHPDGMRNRLRRLPPTAGGMNPPFVTQGVQP